MSLPGVSKSMWWKLKRVVFNTLIRISNRLFGKEIIHRSVFVGWLNKKWLDLVEALSPARRRQSRFERDNPAEPWFVPAAITYLEHQLRSDFIGFEWGCGRSTFWFAHRVQHITSVEGRRKWFEDVSQRLVNDELGAKITLHLAEVTTEHNFIQGEIENYAGAIDDVVDGSLDFIVVDGHFRDACLRRIGNKIRSGGLLIIDNSEVVQKSLLAALNNGNMQAWNNGVWENLTREILRAA